MLLRKLWDEYELMHDLAASTVKHYRMTITAFGSWLGRAGRAGDLNDKTLSEFLRDQQLAGLASRTVESQRKDLLAIWRWAVAAGLHPGPGPDQVRRLKHSELIPSTWTPAEFRRYVDAAGLPRFNRYDRNGHHIGRSMRALALLSHDTGFRLGDLQQLPLAAVTNGGPLVIIQRKTGKAHSRRIYDETKRAVLATVPPQRQLAVGISRGQMWYWHKRICQAADVPQYRFKSLNKVARGYHATQAEIAQPGAGGPAIGHSRATGNNLAVTYYVDPRQLPEPPGPGRLLVD